MDKSTHEKLLGYAVLALFSGTLFYLASSPSQKLSTNQVATPVKESNQIELVTNSDKAQQSNSPSQSMPQVSDFSEYPPVPTAYKEPASIEPAYQKTASDDP